MARERKGSHLKNMLMVNNDCSTFSFGDGSNGQLGYSNGDQVQTTPRIIETFSGKQILSIGCGSKHCLAITDMGEIYSWGNNEYGQLGRRGKLTPQIIERLQSIFISFVACGEEHSLACSNTGTVYSWGKNDCGQLGYGDVDMTNKPRLIKDLHSYHIVKVSCGSTHSLFLSSHGNAFCCGEGKEGQLGLGEKLQSKKIPICIEVLNDRSIIDIQCGTKHTVVLTQWGVVYSFGSNKHGQLGTGDKNPRFVPTVVPQSQDAQVTSISCGALHTMLTFRRGWVYAFGMGEYGQLGTSSNQDEPVPIVLQELLGSRIAKIACGQRHTVALKAPLYVGSPVLVWGSGNRGQLGVGRNQVQPIPQKLDYFSGKDITNIFAGPTYTIVIASGPPPPEYNQLLRLDLNRIKEKLPYHDSLESLLFSCYQYISCLNASFLKRLDDDISPSSENFFALDILSLKEAYQLLIEIPSISKVLLKATNLVISKLKQYRIDSYEMLRSYIILLFNPLLRESNDSTAYLLECLSDSILSLPSNYKQSLLQSFKKLSPGDFSFLVNLFQNFLSYSCKHKSLSRIQSAIKILDCLYRANKAHEIVSYKLFYNDEISQRDLLDDFKNWKENLFSVCNYAFLLNPAAKTTLFHLDALFQMSSFLFESLGDNTTRPFLKLNIRRNHIVEDAFQQLSQLSIKDLKKKLTIRFVDEEGIDQGGLMKEFFQLLVKEITDPKYDLLNLNSETRYFWFSDSVKDDQKFTLLGIMFGLAIYNGNILDVQFSPVTYKKLLGMRVSLEDLIETIPELGYSLKKFLEYPGDVRDMDVYFEIITKDSEGTIKIYPLVENGGEKLVTNENRELYVDKYIDFILNQSVAHQFDSFAQGFLSVCSGPILELCRPEELELMICGDPRSPDFQELESKTKYDGFTKEDTIIQNFWQVTHALSGEDKRKFLIFCTGTDRVPINGLSSLNFIIQRNGPDSERLPTASTCFNLLLLPHYSTKEKLESKLITAIRETSGFHLK